MIGFPNTEFTSELEVRSMITIRPGKYVLSTIDPDDSLCNGGTHCFAFSAVDSSMTHDGGDVIRFPIDAVEGRYDHYSWTLMEDNVLLLSGRRIGSGKAQIDVLSMKTGGGLKRMWTDMKLDEGASPYRIIRPIHEIRDLFCGIVSPSGASANPERIRFSSLTRDLDGNLDGFIKEGLYDIEEGDLVNGSEFIPAFELNYSPRLDAIHLYLPGEDLLNLYLFNLPKIGPTCLGYPICHHCDDSKPGTCLKCDNEHFVLNGECVCGVIDNCELCPKSNCTYCKSGFTKMTDKGTQLVGECMEESSCTNGKFINATNHCVRCSKIHPECLLCNNDGTCLECGQGLAIPEDLYE